MKNSMKNHDPNRSYTTYAAEGSTARKWVDAVAYNKSPPEKYASEMHSLGQELANALLTQIDPKSHGDICVVCTAEDADYLARGLVEILERRGLADRIRFLCMWNARREFDELSVSPVLKQYEEKFNHHKPIFVIIKSIISGACVVKTNLTRMLSSATPSKIFVVSPVMLNDADKRLADEFPAKIASKFEFVTFAIDMTRKGSTVVPGIGGSVYERLGFEGEADKNRYYPSIVKERQERDHVPA